MIRTKRTYEPFAVEDGQRFLVERLWPRGIKKEALQCDAWFKEVAPSPELRRWYGHKLERWDEFQRRYRLELDLKPAAWAPILEAASRGAVTLLFSSRDTQHNSTLALATYLAEQQAFWRRRAR